MKVAVNYLKMLDLEALPELDDSERMGESECTKLGIQLHALGQLETYTQGVVAVDNPYSGLVVSRHREAILEEYRTTVFADRHDPPVR